MYSAGDLVFTVLINFLKIYQLVVLGRVLISWIVRDPENPFYRFFYSLTEPLLGPLRKLLPKGGFLDFSPIILYFLLNILIVILS